MAKVKADAYQAVASRFDRTLLARVNRGGGQELELVQKANRLKRELVVLLEGIVVRIKD